MVLPARIGVLFLLCLWLPHNVAAESSWIGVSLQDYIAALREQGLRVIYSTDLVPETLEVLNEPDDSQPLISLRAALRPYRLTLIDGPSGSVLVVRDQSNIDGSLVLTVSAPAHARGLPGARVYVDSELVGTTDENGRFISSRLVEGPHSLVVSHAEFAESERMAFTSISTKPVPLTVQLRPAVEPLAEVIVTSSLYNLRYQEAGSHTFLDRDLTTKLPDLGDEPVRAIVRLPGVANGGVSTRSHIRGGLNNEQLFLVDGLRLYEPYHLKDFQSVATIVNQNATAGIDLYSAGYQARFGDRMSGVVDMSLVDPPADNITELSLSFFNASVLSMGRFGTDKRGDWLFAIRRSNLDLIIDALDPDLGTPRFGDMIMRVGWELSARSYLSINLLASYDKISISNSNDYEHADAKYRNNIAWLKMRTDWTEILSSTTIVSFTEIDNTRVGRADNPGILFGQVDETNEFASINLKQDWQFDASDTWSFHGGFDVRYLDADYRYDSSLAIAAPFDSIFDNQPLTVHSITSDPNGGQYSVYIESRWRPFEKLVIDVGVRWDQQTYTTANNDDQTSPRINILYRLAKNTILKFGFGQFYQAQEINELQVSDGIDEFFPAQRARHVVASLSHKFASGIDLRIELYQKKYGSLMPRFENAFDPLALIPELQIDRVRIDANKAIAQGAEFMLNGESKNLRWWASYTWAEIEDELDSGTVRRSWDQTHTVKAGLNWDWNKWSFSAAGAVNTGWPKTELVTATVTNPDGSSQLVATTTPRNSSRHATFHTLDARVSRQFDVSRGELTGFLEISNIYGRENPCCTQYSLLSDSDGNPIVDVDEDNWLPLVPSLGVSWRF